VSAALAIELETGPIERARADLAIVCFASTDRPLRGAAGRADWRLCGRLSKLIAQGRVAGHAGEAVLLPGGGGLRAPLLLALGLGPGASLGPAAAASRCGRRRSRSRCLPGSSAISPCACAWRRS
jgi:hypothetical protein